MVRGMCRYCTRCWRRRARENIHACIFYEMKIRDNHMSQTAWLKPWGLSPEQHETGCNFQMNEDIWHVSSVLILSLKLLIISLLALIQTLWIIEIVLIHLSLFFSSVLDSLWLVVEVWEQHWGQRPCFVLFLLCSGPFWPLGDILRKVGHNNDSLTHQLHRPLGNFHSVTRRWNIQ